MNFGPALNFGEGGTSGDESEEGDGENGGEGLRLPSFGSWIGHFFETLDEAVEAVGVSGGTGVDILTSMRGKERRNHSHHYPFYERKPTADQWKA